MTEWALKSPYQTFTRFSGGRYIASPGFTPNAAYQSSRFRTVKARYWAGAWPSVINCWRRAAGRE